MGKLELNRNTRADFNARIWAVTDESARQWGSLTPRGMIAHLAWTLELTLGNKEGPDLSTFFSRNFIKHLVLSGLVQMPKGKVKVPDYFTPEPQGDMTVLRCTLFEKMDLFIQEAEVNTTRQVRHPFFGMMTLREFEVLHGLHFDHHLRQFGA